MTENEAVEIATHYAKTHGLRFDHVALTRHITVDLLDKLHQEAEREGGVRADIEETHQRMRARDREA